jgi:hypothetical protein
MKFNRFFAAAALFGDPLVRFVALARVHLGLFALTALMGILLENATGYSYLQQDPPDARISMKAVSWRLVKKLAEPDAGLSGHKVTILNPADRSVIASGTTDRSGIVEFEIPHGTYTLLGASDVPQTVQVQAGQTEKFKLIVH